MQAKQILEKCYYQFRASRSARDFDINQAMNAISRNSRAYDSSDTKMHVPIAVSVTIIENGLVKEESPGSFQKKKEKPRGRTGL